MALARWPIVMADEDARSRSDRSCATGGPARGTKSELRETRRGGGSWTCPGFVDTKISLS